MCRSVRRYFCFDCWSSCLKGRRWLPLCSWTPDGLVLKRDTGGLCSTLMRVWLVFHLTLPIFSKSSTLKKKSCVEASHTKCPSSACLGGDGRKRASHLSSSWPSLVTEGAVTELWALGNNLGTSRVKYCPHWENWEMPNWENSCYLQLVPGFIQSLLCIGWMSVIWDWFFWCYLQVGIGYWIKNVHLSRGAIFVLSEHESPNVRLR